ncbi:MAG TPA: response regulator, partial [Spirochaetia bacterium]|nr:response regulator [Spirochaetia bacterium]
MNKIRIGFLSETSFFLHFNQLLEGIMQSAGQHNVDVVRLMTIHPNFVHHPDQMRLFIELTGRLKLDGIVYLGWMPIVGETAAAKTMFDPLGLPYVSLGKYHSEIPSVYQNGYKEIAKLIDHALTVHGVRKILFVHPINADDRIEGFRDYMKMKNLYDPKWEVTAADLGAYNVYDMDIRAEKVLSVIYDRNKLDPDCIIDLYSHEAAMLVQGLKSRGLKVPEKVKILCWEDVDTSRYCDIPITAFYFPFRELGFEAAEKLIAIIQGRNPPPVTEIAGRLVTRSSCGCHMHALALVGDERTKSAEAVPPPAPSAGATSRAEIRGDSGMDGCGSIDENWRRAISEGNDDVLIRYLENCFYYRQFRVQDIHSIRDHLLRLRNESRVQGREHPALREKTEQLSLKAQLLIQDKVEQLSGKMNLGLLEQSWANLNMNQFLATSFKLDMIFNVLATSLRRDGINCYLYTFREQGNNYDDLVLRFAFREGTVLELPEEMREFGRLKEVLFWKEDRQLIFSHLLCVRNEWIGVAFYEPGQMNERIYQDLSVQLASSIKSALVVKSLETANEKLAELDNIKNDFIANITHDFRSPLMIILNNTDLGLKYDGEADIDVIRKRYRIIFEASLKLKNTIDRLLDLAKMDSKGIAIHVCDIPLTLWLENIVEFYRSATINTGICITTDFPPHEIKDFYSDPEKLEEVFNNIISNAFKFIDPACGTIQIALRDLGEMVRIAVSDNGMGIPASKLEAIFKRFEQIERMEDRPLKGTGIGLAFSRQLISYLHGEIWAESDGPGKGARFVIELKKGKDHFTPEELAPPAGVSLPGQVKRQEVHFRLRADLAANRELMDVEALVSHNNEDGEFDYLKALIMIIDDNRAIREIEREYLEKSGYLNFILVADGKQGIEAAFSYHPDLIICDYDLPGMKGDELHDQLQRNPEFKKIPFIFLTALD